MTEPQSSPEQHERFMGMALQEAAAAREEGEIPIGAVIVVGDRVIARGHNQTERLNDCTAHAEMIALTAAFNFMGSKYLPEATLYVTVEPCLMCAGALHWSKIGAVVYGAPDDKNGYRRYTGEASPFHPKTALSTGVLEGECRRLLVDFFKNRR